MNKKTPFIQVRVGIANDHKLNRYWVKKEAETDVSDTQDFRLRMSYCLSFQ